jgi:hypothetical protein
MLVVTTRFFPDIRAACLPQMQVDSSTRLLAASLCRISDKFWVTTGVLTDSPTGVESHETMWSTCEITEVLCQFLSKLVFLNSLLRHHGFYFVLGWKRWTSCWFWWEYCWDEPLYEEGKNLVRTSKENCWMYGQAWILVWHLYFNRTDESYKHRMCSEIYACVCFQPKLARFKKLAAHLIWLVFGIAFFLFGSPSPRRTHVIFT